MAICGVGAVQLKVPGRRGKPGLVLGAAQGLGVAKCGGAGLLQDTAAGLKGYAHPAVLLTAPSSELGRSLVARTDIAPGTTLLSLPVTSSLQVIRDCTVEAPLPWSIEMALRLIDMRHRAQQSPGGSLHAAWLEALPPARTFTLPFSTFTEEQLLGCQEEDTINVARSFRSMLQSAAEVLCDDLAALGADEGDLYWAVGLAHSRSFITQDSAATITHTIAPGIDMANHSFEPSATVSFRHSPDTCQGWEAADEVCEQPAGANVTRVELLAGEQGIEKDEAITINYGASHDDDVFYLFYGFLPERETPSPVVIFGNLAELAEYACPEGAPDWVSTASQSKEYDRLVVTADGFDQRAVDAVGKLLAQRGKDLRLADIMHLLAERCRQKLATYTTTIEDDRVLLKQADTSGGVTLSIRYRLRKKELLRGVITNLQVLQTQTDDTTGRSVLSKRRAV